MSTYHVPVMLDACMDALAIKPNGVYVDATTGGGGHSAAILRHLSPTGKLICLDQDADALCAAKARLGSPENVDYIHANFRDLAIVLRESAPQGIDGILFDLGVSSYQLDTPTRGFAIRYQGPLDMRMDQHSNSETAAELIDRISEAELVDLLFTFGEEPRARRIAKSIVDSRPITTTEGLVDAVRRAMPSGTRPGQVHPATKVFQALRIAVNQELDVLPVAIRASINALADGGRIAVMSYHSLEDRITKRIFGEGTGKVLAADGWSVTDVPQVLSLVNRKPMIPTDAEIRLNLRSRSAKLRVAEKLASGSAIGRVRQ